jgi:hypothetical protein
MTPLLPHDLDLMSWPLTYISWGVCNTDDEEHEVSIFFSAGAQIAVNTPDQAVVWEESEIGDLAALRIGSADQPVLGSRGDDRRIDWGYLYVAAPKDGSRCAVGPNDACLRAFADGGTLAEETDTRMPRAADDATPGAAFVFDMGTVGERVHDAWLMLAYDDLYSIDYMGERLRPYWRRNGADMADLLADAASRYAYLPGWCEAFDQSLVYDMTQFAGEKYKALAVLAYRECLAGNKIAAGPDGEPFVFPKENTSNGCIGTVDVIYPMAPLFLLLSPKLARGMLAPVLDYATSPRWRFPFAPHDLGQYPLATGQVYGGGEETEENQMPVEESGNMILLLAALARSEGNADFASRYWPVVTQWVEYLVEKGFDPENQLCTDDFAGHLAHNANLSIKAIEAIGAYARLCELRGEPEETEKYRRIATDMASRWKEAADDGDHYRLTFDRPGTWSQKYNLAWDKILNLNLFGPEVARKEMAFYLTHQNRYGLPLDSRSQYTKTDWIFWTATLAGNHEEFAAIIAPVFDFANETPDRVPFADFYWTHDGREAGMHARPVMGGLFLPQLTCPVSMRMWSPADGSAYLKL